MWWNFVGRSHEEIAQARADWMTSARFGEVEGYVGGRSAVFVGPRVHNSTLGAAVSPTALTGGEDLTLGDIDIEHSYSSILDVARGLAVPGENPSGDGRVRHLPTVPARTTRRRVRPG